jgi:hypothetical protein
MKVIIALLLLTATATHGAEASVGDGLYVSAPITAARSVRSQDGREVSPGAKQELQILDKQLRSEGNANTSFALSLTIPFDASVGPGSYVLAVAGTVYRQTSSGASGEQTSSLHFRIVGEDRAGEVARYLDLPIERFRHPGHRLHVTFSPTRPTFARGEQVTATLRIVNLGTEPVAFMKGERNRALRDNQYVFTAYRWGEQVPDIGSSAHSGGLAARVVLQPGAAFEDTVSLSLWFDFREAGLYEIHGLYRLGFVDPASRPLLPFWRDFASAEFTVAIE